jgi:hypothetical protein
VQGLIRPTPYTYIHTYNCCWSSPAQSLSRLSPVGLMTIFYCLKFEIPSTWRTKSPYLYPPGKVWPGYTPRHWVLFTSPPTTRRATVEVFDPTSTREWTDSVLNLFQLYHLYTDGVESTVHCCTPSFLWERVSLPCQCYRTPQAWPYLSTEQCAKYD